MDSNRRGFSGSQRHGIDLRRAMTESHRSSVSSNFLESIRARKQLKEAKDEERGKKAIDLAEDCSSCIFLWLPIDALQRSGCVCKSWNNIVMNPSFIEAHLNHSESGLLCVSYAGRNARAVQAKKTFSVETQLLKQQESLNIFQRELPPEMYLHFLEINDGVSFAELKTFNVGCCGRVLGSCNGLVLLENKLKKAGLVVMNPVTRKVTALPGGTIVQPNKESYGFAFKSSTKEHIAVHLFQEELGYASCEILTIEKRKWATVKGPPSGAFISFEYNPVVAEGALHWLLHNETVLSLGVEDMKFRTISLPKTRGFHDCIVEIGGFLCFVTHEQKRIDIWALRNASEESWTKEHTIRSRVLPDMVPLSGSRYCRWMILRSDSGFPVEDEDEDQDQDQDQVEDEDEAQEEAEGRIRADAGVVRSLYVYDFYLGVMNKVQTKHSPPIFHGYLPHVNSLLNG